MSQAKFDAQVEELMAINRDIRDAVTQEAVELAALQQVFQTEIADLKAKLEECMNAPVDTSRLDEAISELRQRAATISTIVTSPVQHEPPQPAEEPPAETPSEEVPAEAPTEETTQ